MNRKKCHQLLWTFSGHTGVGGLTPGSRREHDQGRSEPRPLALVPGLLPPSLPIDVGENGQQNPAFFSDLHSASPPMKIRKINGFPLPTTRRGLQIKIPILQSLQVIERMGLECFLAVLFSSIIFLLNLAILQFTCI